jgi:hypothetical protein
MRVLAALCSCILLVSCGSGDCSSDNQKSFLRSWTNDLYLWYSEVPNVDPAPYTPLDYFAQLKTPAVTASGKPKDRFHFTYPTTVWQQLSQSGIEVGYGVTWILVARTPPRMAVAGYDEPNMPASPALANGIVRGVKVLYVDGVDLVNANDQASVNKLNAGLFPSKADEKHTFVVQDPGATTTRTVTMSAVAVTETPVQSVHTIDTSTGKVGYMLFNDHIATAEAGLVNAITTLKTAGISDLILDVRYNGGGYLAIASELAYMIAPAATTTGKTFEKTVFNDKHPTIDPVTGQPIVPTGFISQTVGFSVSSGMQLPSLGLSRVFVLTGNGTCSATEAVLNGLSGVDVQVIQIGATTCGKPYGFYPQDKCGTTYFSIQFQGINQKGFGDYPDGFTPASTTLPGFPGCVVSDDFGHALGDSQEALLAAALQYRDTQTCPAPPPAANALVSGGLRGDGAPVKPPWRTNRLMTGTRTLSP